MKYFYLFLMATLFSFTSYSQIVYEPGYIINNTGQRNEVLIKNDDWLYNPTEFSYRDSEKGNTRTAKIDEIQEFGVYNYSRYIRSTVDIDRSPSDLKDLSLVRDPIFKEETLFLEVLIEGKADLYKYQDGQVTRYFYNVGGSDIEQLIFKRFKVEQHAIKNTAFRKQLWDHVRCGAVNASDLQRTEYSRKDLVRYFVAYNECENEEVLNYQTYKKKDLLNISVRTGVDITSFKVDFRNENRTTRTFYDQSNAGYRIGIEAEIILPFNRNKWGVLIEPTYRHLQFSEEVYEQNVSVDYNSFEIPLGLRHYFFLNDDSALFLNAAFVVDFASSSSLDLENGPHDSDLIGNSYITAGMGYKFRSKYAFEVRYGFSRNVLAEHKYWTSEFSNVSFILGYTIF